MKAKAQHKAPRRRPPTTSKRKFPHGHELYCAIVFGTGVALVWGGLAAVMLWAFILARG